MNELKLLIEGYHTPGGNRTAIFFIADTRGTVVAQAQDYMNDGRGRQVPFGDPRPVSKTDLQNLEWERKALTESSARMRVGIQDPKAS